MSSVERFSARLMRAGLFGFGVCLPWTIAGAQISLGVLAGGVMMAYALGRRARCVVFAPLAALLIASVLSLAFHAGDLSGLQLLKGPLALGALVLGFRFLDEEGEGAAVAEQVLRCFLVSAALAGVYGVVQNFTGMDLVARMGLRSEPVSFGAPGIPGRFSATGAFSRRLTYAHVLAMAIPAGVALFVSGKRRLLWGIAIMAATMGLVAAYARAAFLAVGAGSALILARSLGRRRLLSMVAALAVGLGALLVLPGTVDRLASGFKVSENEDRAFIWARAAEVLEDHPVLGVGVGRFPAVAGPYYDSRDPGFPMRTWAHNTLLTVAVETGVLGLAAFIWMWLTFFAAPWNTLRTSADPRARGLALAALGGLVALAGISLFHDYPANAQATYAGMLLAAVGLLPGAIRL